MKRFWSLLVIFFGLFLFKVPALPVADHDVGGFNIQSMAGPVVDLDVISPAALPLTDQVEIVIAPLDVGVEKPILNCAIRNDLMNCVQIQCSDPMSMNICKDSYAQNQKTRYRAEGTSPLEIGER